MLPTRSPNRRKPTPVPNLTICQLLLTALLLAVLGCGGGADGQVLFRGRCPKIPPMRGFDPKRVRMMGVLKMWASRGKGREVDE